MSHDSDAPKPVSPMLSPQEVPEPPPPEDTGREHHHQRSGPVQDFDLYDMLVRVAYRFPGKTALIEESGREYSFMELLQRVDLVATQLADRGLATGQRVGVLALNSVPVLELFLACARQGLVVVPINWRLQKSEIQMYAEHTNLDAFAFDSSAQESKPDLEIDHWIDLDDWLETEQVPASLAAPTTSFLTAPGIFRIAPRPTISPDQPWIIIATAAVDVIPRRAALSHRNLLSSNIQEIAALGLSPSDCNLVALPLFHIAGLGHCLAHLHVGATNVIVPGFDAAQTVELIDRHEVTHISDFPPVLTQVLDQAQEVGSTLESLRLVTGLDSPETMQRLHEQTAATFWTGFGQAETTGFVTLQNAREQLGCAGPAAELCAVKLVTEYDQDVSWPDIEGEICVRGPLVFLGYDGEPDVTEYTFRGGWHHTGDIGRFDADGNLFYVKRKAEKELIKPGGENVYPAEVEGALVNIAGIRRACVFGVSDPKWGEAIKAVIEVEPGFSLSLEEVRERVGNQIARFKRPKYVVAVDRMPLTESDEVDREAIKETHS